MTMLSKIAEVKNPVSVYMGLDVDSKILLIFDMICTLSMGIGFPVIDKMFMADVSVDELGQRMFIGTICGIAIEQFWTKNIRNKMLKYYLVFCIVETGLTTGLVGYLLIFGWDYEIFLWGSILYGSFISRVVSKLTSAYSNQLWKGRAREDRSNDLSYINKIVGLLSAGLISIGLVPTLEQALFLWCISSAVDDFGWMIVYYRNRSFLDSAVLNEKDGKRDEEKD